MAAVRAACSRQHLFHTDQHELPVPAENQTIQGTCRTVLQSFQTSQVGFNAF